MKEKQRKAAEAFEKAAVAAARAKTLAEKKIAAQRKAATAQQKQLLDNNKELERRNAAYLFQQQEAASSRKVVTTSEQLSPPPHRVIREAVYPIQPAINGFDMRMQVVFDTDLAELKLNEAARLKRVEVKLEAARILEEAKLEELKFYQLQKQSRADATLRLEQEGIVRTFIPLF